MNHPLFVNHVFGSSNILYSLVNLENEETRTHRVAPSEHFWGPVYKREEI